MDDAEANRFWTWRATGSLVIMNFRRINISVFQRKCSKVVFIATSIFKL